MMRSLNSDLRKAYAGLSDVDDGLSDRKIRPEWTCSFTAYFTVLVFYFYPQPYRYAAKMASTNQTVSCTYLWDKLAVVGH